MSAAVIIAFGGWREAENPVGTVSGAVTFRGEPVGEGQVSFRSKETGKGNLAQLDLIGGFSLRDALEVGTYTVFVTPSAPPAPDMDQEP